MIEDRQEQTSLTKKKIFTNLPAVKRKKRKNYERNNVHFKVLKNKENKFKGRLPTYLPTHRQVFITHAVVGLLSEKRQFCQI